MCKINSKIINADMDKQTHLAEISPEDSFAEHTWSQNVRTHSLTDIRTRLRYDYTLASRQQCD